MSVEPTQGDPGEKKDAEVEKAENFIAGMKVCDSPDALRVYMASTALQTVLGRWDGERPELKRRVIEAWEERQADMESKP